MEQNPRTEKKQKGNAKFFDGENSPHSPLASIIPPRRSQPMNLQFIDENDTFQGKRDLALNQKLVRAHVMREIRKKQKAARNNASARSLRAQLSTDSNADDSTDWVTNSSTRSSNILPSPYGPMALDEQQKTASFISRLGNGYRLCAQCMKPMQSGKHASQEPDDDACCVDHEHWSGLILPKRGPNPVFRSWISLCDQFIAAGIGQTLGPELQESFPLFFRQFTIFNSMLYPLEPKDIRAICASPAITESQSALLHVLCFTGAMHGAASRLGGFDLPLIDQNYERRTIQAAIRHKSKALSLMNEVLTDPHRAVTESSIVTVAVLYAVEGIAGDLKSAAIHSRGLARMIDIKGGLESLTPQLLGDIYTSVTKTAAISLQEPDFPLSSHWKNRLELLSSTDFKTGPPPLPHLASRFFDPDLARIFHPDMLRNFRFMRHLINYTEFTIRNPKLPRDYSYTTGDYTTVEHALLSFPFEGRSITTIDDHVQECTRIAAILYFNLAVWGCHSYFSLVKSLAVHLRRAVLKLDFSNSGRLYPDLILWILFMGSFAAEGKTERAWFVLNVADVAKSMGLRRWDEVKRLLIKFFYTERILDVPFTKIWDEAFLLLDDS